MRVAQGKHRKAAPCLKPQIRHRVRNIRELAAEAGLMVEGGSEDELGGHDDEGKGGEDDEGGGDGGGDEDGRGDEGGEGGQGGQGGDTMAAQDVINMPPLHVMAVPIYHLRGARRHFRVAEVFR